MKHIYFAFLLSICLGSVFIMCKDSTGPAEEETGYEYIDSSMQVGGRDVIYTVAKPKDYDSNSGPYPLVFALHYGGNPVGAYGRQFLEILVLPALQELNAIFIAPVNESGSWQNQQSVDIVNAFLDKMNQDYNIDQDKKIITGFSMGGLGTWYMAVRMPETFAAGVALSAKPSQSVVEQYKDMPLYVIHSKSDELFPYNEVEDIVLNLITQGKDMKLKLLSGISHYNTMSFTGALRESIPWIRSKW